MLPSDKKPKVFIVGGLLFGDEGKGTTVEYLAHKFQAQLVIRYNGGPQAMHHVVFQDQSFHCFSQFGSGSFFPNCKTLLSQYMVISPHTLLVEMEFLKREGVSDIENKLFIDSECIIVTPMHKLINRLLETLRSKNNKYGTTGMGVGVTIDDAYNAFQDKLPKGHLFSSKDKINVTCLQIKDLTNDKILYEKLKKMMTEKLKTVKEILENFKKDPTSVYENEFLEGDIKPETDLKSVLEQANKLVMDFLKGNTTDSLFQFYRRFVEKFSNCFIDSATLISEYISKGYNIIMEGAQGALLDRIYGFYPHITKSLCSPENALNLLKDLKSDSFEIIKIGVLRIFSSRHGNGPFLTHNTNWSKYIKEDHNSSSGWQGDFRIGPFDVVAAKYGIDIFNPDYISLTCLDKLLIAANEHDDFAKFPINCGYKSKDPIKIEGLFVYNEKKNYIERIEKRKEEEAWRSLDLVKNLRNMEGYEQNLDEVRDQNLDNKLKEIIEIECKKKFKDVKEENNINLGSYVAVIQKLLGVPFKILSFGASFQDKIFVEHT